MSTPEPPVTADHTPERPSAGSAEDRETLRRDLDDVISSNATWAVDPITSQVDAALEVAEEHLERILAAHLADVEARLAASDRALVVQQETTRRVDRLRAEAEARLAAIREKWEGTHDGVLSPGLRLAVDDLDREWFNRMVERRGREFTGLHPDPSGAT